MNHIKTIFRNRIALLLIAWMTFSPIIALGQGLYSKKTEVKTETKDKAIGPMLRAEGNGGEDGGNPDKIEPAPLGGGLYLLLLACLGYGLFIWRKEQKREANLSTNK
ncbi:MAG: hypothetical protein LBO74_10340 [Candidatus Symbiothrix sp.]|nr:hypothetical protein [Candidatus Symbiothrix sp.]